MASLKECKSCGKEISKNAKACPHCGEPSPKKTSLLTWLVLILFIAVIFNIDTTTSSSSSSSRTAPKTPKELATPLVSIQDFTWGKAGFDNIMEATFTVSNKSKYTIKDIEIECNHYSKSGTKIDSNTRTIYDTVNANDTKTFSNFNMGFIHNQAVKSGCIITDFKI